MPHRASDHLSENLRFLCLQADTGLAHWLNLLRGESSRFDAQYAQVLQQRIEQACVAAYRDASEVQMRQWHLHQSLSGGVLRLCHLAADLQPPGELEKAHSRLALAFVECARACVAGLSPLLQSEAYTATSTWRLQADQLENKAAHIKGKPAADPAWAGQRALLLQLHQGLRELGRAIGAGSLSDGAEINHLQKFHRHLRDKQSKAEQLSVRALAHTRSGNTVSGVSRDEKYLAVLKQGLKRKLKRERAGVERWQAACPGLAPQVLSWQKDGVSAALLMEHLPGLTWEKLLLNEPEALQEKALAQLCSTLKRSWRKTRSIKVSPADFVGQLQRRLADVFQLHPEYRPSCQSIGELHFASVSQLLEAAVQREAQLTTPFNVLIHGDFNVDNILFDPEKTEIRFIDLHRSRMMDYVQDISVFMVSHFRLPIPDRRRRGRALALALQFYQFAQHYAQKHEDRHFEDRMALALARSFISSTRFTLDKRLARDMFLRGRYLIERSLDRPVGEFRLPVEELFHA